MTSLGPCGAFLPDGTVCDGHYEELGQVGALIEGQCPKCGSFGSVPAANVRPVAAAQRRLEQAGLPARFLGVKFDESADNRVALRYVRDWIAGYDREPIPAPALWGRAGRGKSHLLTAICVRLIRERGCSVLFRSTRNLLRELQAFEGGAEQAWRRAVTVDVLALDDLGAERGTEWRTDQLADLVDARYEEKRPIVFASNFPPQAWPESMDERTASRLRSMVFPVELQGLDRRLSIHSPSFAPARPGAGTGA